MKDSTQAINPAALTGSSGGRRESIPRSTGKHTSWAGRTRCDVTVRLTASELATLTTLPQAAGPALRHLSCELAALHDGPHVAFTLAALEGDQWWWLRWTGRVREVIQLDPCDDGPVEGPGCDFCLLPDGHPGPHSFEIRLSIRIGTKQRREAVE